MFYCIFTHIYIVSHILNPAIFKENICLVIFIIARDYKQLKCPLTKKWIMIMWYIYIMKYYPDAKKLTS